MIRVADYIIDRLYKEGVKHIYMVTGRGILYLSDAVAKHQDITGISVHHEQAASYAAMAYAQYNNSIGACLVSTGCAATNAITGLLCAWQDGVPCVFISGNNKLQETTRYTGIPLRTFGQQETNIVAIVEKLTKYSVMITDPKKIVYELDKALFFANHGRKGPVWIDVPLDVQDCRIEVEDLEHYIIKDENESDAKDEDVEYIINAMLTSCRPAVLLGSGVRTAGAIEDFEYFLEKHPMPVTYSASASDTYGTKHPLSIGAVGSMGGTRAGNFTVQNSDLLIVLGSSLSPMTTSTQYQKFARAAKVIVVDIDPVEHTKSILKIDRLIIGDVKILLQKLNGHDFSCDTHSWIQKCVHWKQIFSLNNELCKENKLIDLYQLTERLSRALPEEAIVCTDAGLEELIIPANIRLGHNQRCIHPSSQGAMGYALPASIGIYHASNQTVVSVIGDGSIMMNLQELETITYQKIPVKIMIINNNGYSIIRQRQTSMFRTRTIGNDHRDGVGIPDFRKVAECFEIPYMLIEDSAELDVKINELLLQTGPVICEVMGIENQQYLHSAYVLNKKGRSVNRPLEDQSPFLDRELFLAEMLIEPIDQ